ncbi:MULTISPECIES: DUF4190 domain-containing protein [Streptomyces]|uniref:DUF4190 domain-containing protein n=1 Tax=Streptomyces odorifer TaxID=53450 RepID=A0A7Y6F076_9ACTN|nr:MULTISPECIES: DUF4190 domain-containing protein [Streptomyces]NUV35255.1 DUF4190 domain-containing protein [Streptomyces sp. KAI-27]NUV48353.1 DUF4190 domain-containing protein [Streptomyces sp. CAI-78]MBL0780932.1 DUF4190 domain-containing protein [Streptomyces albidoflavus]MBL0803737.1 DUF4190 domain-containing protein [Streptomyces albidoflavus]MBV1956977.1 DUF4190 domain-containing protein [Streptomyces sp. BV333]
MSVTQTLPGSATAERDNRAARVSAYAVAFAAFVGGGGYLPAAVFFPLTLTWMAVIFLCGITAIVAGHVARFRAKRHGLRGRWLALAGIVGGWICVLVAVLALAAVVGVLGGLAVLIDS